ncbi:peptidylprolyl isomerase [Candidatus Micrarchaeota archaeon CG_4_10_14_0_2_um_filter_60_11]|nr:MAG: hypothetical protein AUJ16_03680 [Candidatus Micrarchaeota archaeon CG1_02_60_51]PIN96204.1 MAG: peptidylprolyl isomerase [Candidatus Micrarchaeota archaeon CG10_big_fil_rev_8_21_14_0_10_60_32]PIO02333.1 MAG: peptidylprolyl isomerase [Candidatus Micrarchaeota archaeon CG09_land_8_20_14_0_10_60_16]PIY91449.1 MAG: peptidylprolyl isomerase [Candidatus Micrarchaeota archaeon CG_4_10_14_0_8_um_filter_60_7]PIZ91254.1 MAG: peptidylprolyl isomerase [Candidatus Micrarchaeota archaeon CG_4_10_14_
MGVSLVKTAAKGDTVAVDYVGTFDNATVFDTSLENEAVKAGLPLRGSYAPLEFTVGAGQMISGFDAAVVGMREGEEKSVHLTASEAYGEKRSDLIVQVPRANVPADAAVGSALQSSSGMAGIVTALTDTAATIDFNSPMAGKPLNFKIILRTITKPR